MDRHFSTSVYIYNKNLDKFLFIKHKKLKKWLQPGGHLELNELPDECALREVKEETNLDVELYGERLPRPQDQIRPFAIQINVVKPGEHEHMDFVYLALTTEVNVKEDINETEGIRWFSIEEIMDEKFDTFYEQKKWCKYFYDLMHN